MRTRENNICQTVDEKKKVEGKYLSMSTCLLL